MTAQEQLGKWYSGKMVREQKKNDELSVPCDLIVIDVKTRVCTSKCVWVDIRSKSRLKRLIEREQGGCGSDSIVVAVEARTISLGQILKGSEIIKLQ